MSLKRIRLELARDPDYPNGSRDCGYEFAAPLDDSGYLVAEEWRAEREKCRVKRYWNGEPSELGKLIHKPGGVWAFDYNPEETTDDEPGYRLDKHRFIPGEYVSFREHDGHTRTFRVTAVTDL